MRAKCRISGIAAIFLALAASSAVAGLWPCVSRTIPSSNGKYLLVLLTPEDEKSYRAEYDPEIDGPWTKDEIRQRHESILAQQQIEGLYPQSGLYRNDGSTVLLWPIEYQPTPKDIYVSNDGVHLIVAFLNWDNDSASERGNALEFYAQGQPLAIYNEDQLLVGYFGRALLSRFAGIAWPTCTRAKLDDSSKTFEIATNWGDKFRFEIVTGNLVYSKMPWTLKAVFTLILIVVALTAWWICRRIGLGRSSS